MIQRVCIVGMHGLGDNLHQRAVIRHWMQTHEVWLETPWPSVYHDLVADGLRLAGKTSTLRTQRKNAEREAASFHATQLPSGQNVRVCYPAEDVRRLGSVLAAMLTAAGCEGAEADFRLPIRPEWLAEADRLIASLATDKPILIYRPLVERNEWGGCKARNPDREAYQALFEAIRARFFVVSVADLVDGVEWISSHEAGADVEYHGGELVFETLAALVSRAALVFAAPGFAVPLAQAVGTPVVAVFGGYESARSFSLGARFAPYLGIEPVTPCECFAHDHACDKRIDVPAATERLLRFLDETANHRPVAA